MSEFRWLDLERHPQSQVDAIERICVGYVLRSAVWKLAFEVFGDIDALDLPPVHRIQPGQDLWQHSCFELFVAQSNQHYREFNFAPDGRYAAMDFSGYRQGLRPLKQPMLAQAESWCTAKRYRLDLELSEAARPDMAKHAGLSAIVQDKAGHTSWWALQHPPGKPDFHHIAAFYIPLA